MYRDERSRVGQTTGYRKAVKKLGPTTIADHLMTVRYLIDAALGADTRLAHRVRTRGEREYKDAIFPQRTTTPPLPAGDPHRCRGLPAPRCLTRHVGTRTRGIGHVGPIQR